MTCDEYKQAVDAIVDRSPIKSPDDILKLMDSPTSSELAALRRHNDECESCRNKCKRSAEETMKNHPELACLAFIKTIQRMAQDAFKNDPEVQR